jgi:hypothetical protein
MKDTLVKDKVSPKSEVGNIKQNQGESLVPRMVSFIVTTLTIVGILGAIFFVSNLMFNSINDQAKSISDCIEKASACEKYESPSTDEANIVEKDFRE